MLYKNIIHWDWNLESREGTPLEVDEHVSWVRYAFFEYNLDPIFKIKALKSNFKADLEIVYSKVIPLGTIYLDQSLEGIRRVKLSSIEEITSYAYSSSAIKPQPIAVEMYTYKKA